jgi:hypothetical protein
MIRKSLTALALTAGLLAAPSAFACTTGCGSHDNGNKTVFAPNLSTTTTTSFGAQSATANGKQLNLGTVTVATKGGFIATQVGGTVNQTQE